MSRISLLFPLFLLALTGCAPQQPDEQEQAVVQSAQRAQQVTASNALTPAPIDAAACDATQVQWLIGTTPTTADTEQAKRDAGASILRVLKPNQPVPMDFSSQRLNLEVDAKGKVLSVRCG